MGSHVCPNYACLFVGYGEEKMMAEYQEENLNCTSPTWMMLRVLPLVLSGSVTIAEGTSLGKQQKKKRKKKYQTPFPDPATHYHVQPN